jgi:hypothetical protein
MSYEALIILSIITVTSALLFRIFRVLRAYRRERRLQVHESTEDLGSSSPPMLYEKTLVTSGSGTESWKDIMPLSFTLCESSGGKSQAQVAIVILMPSKRMRGDIDQGLLYELGTCGQLEGAFT